MTASTLSFDIAIIGAGPAGTAAAITAARFGAQVAVFEAGEFPRRKVCGEFVSAESLDVLRDLLRNVPEAATALRGAPVIERVRLYLTGQCVESKFKPPALSIPRYEMDRLLWLAAQQAGAATFPNCEVLSVPAKSPFVLKTAAGEVRANCVIVAAGRWSRFRPDVAITDGPKWIGVKAHYHEVNASKSTDLYFFEYGYCGVQPVADDVVNACAMVRSDRAKSLGEVLRLHPELAARSRDWQLVTEPVSTAPLIYREPEPVRDNLVFVGDAAAFIDPFVGDGISIALRTGRMAGELLSKGCGSAEALAAILASYRLEYEKQFAPLIRSASRIRRALSAPSVLLRAGIPLLRIPGVIPYMIRKTRQVS
jgi:flavin-dependent dehydrogenase